MKVLAIHNYHRSGSASGDDQVFRNETSLLEAHGNKVIRYTVSNDDFDNADLVSKIKTTLGMLWSERNYRAIKMLIEQEKPDIVHVHTFFPLLSPSVLYAAKQANVPVVATLHDTRFICPCATSLRGTKLCNDCGDGHYLRMCKYNCFKGSKLQSFIVAVVFKFHRLKKSFFRQIDRYICLNDNQIQLLESIGFDDRKIKKKYNFMPDPEGHIRGLKDDSLPQRYVVFYGRLGEEKGIRFLMKMWDDLPEIPLVVMGSGPLEEEFRVWAELKDNVSFLGYIPHDKCLPIVKGSEFVVFPSIWYEGCSMVEIEAQSLKKGIVTFDIGFSAEAVKNDYNGYKVPLGKVEDFIGVIRKLWNAPEKCIEIGENARNDYEKKYLPEDNYHELISIYRELMV